MSDAAIAIHLRPPPLDPYAESTIAVPGPVERFAIALQSVAVTQLAGLRRRRLQKIVRLVHRHGSRLRSLDDAALRAEAQTLRRLLRECEEPDIKAVAHAFACIREASGRVLGMRHHDVQLTGAHALVRGMIAEMNTGEGKTLTATLAAITMALSGRPVHVVTVNDYLAQRDAEKLRPLYGFFGLRVGVVIQGLDPDARRKAYACDVTYCTNKELAFDYLKDRLALGQKRGLLHLKFEAMQSGRLSGQLLLRGLHFAIVDEADSVFIDEARTPLILSREAKSDAEERVYRQAVDLAQSFAQGRDYRIHPGERRIELTPAGHDRLAEIAKAFGGVWLSRAQREDLCMQALTALHLMLRDEHYIVRDGKVQIVDEYTGRIMADRFWSDGLHQMVEVKEGCSISGKRVTMARMTYQRFFRRYRTLSGMTGTGEEVAGEMWRVFGLAVARIPPHKPSRRRVLPDYVAATADEKWRLVTERCKALQARGIPVLVGTKSVAASNQLSAYLTAAGVDHVVLNAAQDAAEAAIVAKAGEPGQITVATNIAGRGTDISIPQSVSAAGGLHVLMTERHDAGRIDRQLAGRCARQGEPGVYAAILSLEDALLAESGLWMTRLIARLGGQPARRWALRRAQRHAERLHARMRRDLLRNDENLDHALAFSGKAE